MYTTSTYVLAGSVIAGTMLVVLLLVYGIAGWYLISERFADTASAGAAEERSERSTAHGAYGSIEPWAPTEQPAPRRQRSRATGVTDLQRERLTAAPALRELAEWQTHRAQVRRGTLEKAAAFIR